MMINFRERFEKLIGHPFARDVAVLQVGTIFNTGIGFLTALVLARLLGPEQYGFYALVFALAGIINIFQEFGVGQGTINLLARAYAAKDNPEIKRILGSFTRISIWASLIPGVLGVIAAPFIGRYVYGDPVLGKLAAVVVATTALTFFFPLATIALQVTRKIPRLTVWESVNKFLNSAIPISLVLAGLGVWGIVYGQLITEIIISFAGIGIYIALVKQDELLPRFSEFWKEKVSREYLKKFFRFGFAIAINKNLVKLAQTIPILFAGFFLATDSSLGYYKIALAYMSLPTTLLGPVSRLLNVQLSQTELWGTGKLLRRFFQVTFLSVAIALVLTIPLLVAGPYFLRFFFPEYEPSISLIYPLALYPVVMSAGVGLGPMFRIMNRMRVAIGINIAMVLLMIPAAYFLIGEFAVRGLIATVLIFSLLPNLLSFIYFAKVNRGAGHEREAV